MYGSALIFHTVNLNGSIHTIKQLFYNRHAKSGTFILRSCSLISLNKWLKYILQEIL